MAKRRKRRLVSLLMAVMLMGNGNLGALADTTGDGSLESPKVTVIRESSTDEDTGAVSTTTTTLTEAAGTGADGEQIQRREKRVETTVRDAEGETLSQSGRESGTETTVAEKTEGVPPLTAPLEENSSVTVTSGPVEPAVTEETTEEGRSKTTVTETQRELTGTMGAVETVYGGGESAESELTPLAPDFDGMAVEGDDVYASSSINAPKTPELETKPEGYDFFYSNYGAISEYYLDHDGSTSYVNQFQLTDYSDPEAAGKDRFTVYCVDIATGDIPGYWYTMDNLESGTYYPTEDAENHIRGIVSKGYWGTASGTGSLEQLQAELQAALEDGSFTDLTAEEIAELTAGEAMNATQAAIWAYANGAGPEMSDLAVGGDADAKKRVDALYRYLCGMTEEAAETPIINTEHFVRDMSITVNDKLEEAGDSGHGVYDAEVNFTLVVTPDAEKDELIVKVVANGEVLKTARLAGEGDDEHGELILPDENGAYTLTGLKLVENEDIRFTLKLEGTQYLERGVYVYTSETRNGVDSQTFVGVAEGSKAVDVEQTVSFRFDVTEPEVTTVYEWSRAWETLPEEEAPEVPGGEPEEPEIPGEPEEPKTPEEAPGEEEKTEESPEAEETPLYSDVPKTGDPCLLWLGLSVLSGLGLAVLWLGGKKQKDR